MKRLTRVFPWLWSVTRQSWKPSIEIAARWSVTSTISATTNFTVVIALLKLTDLPCRLAILLSFILSTHVAFMLDRGFTFGHYRNNRPLSAHYRDSMIGGVITCISSLILVPYFISRGMSEEGAVLLEKLISGSILVVYKLVVFVRKLGWRRL